MQIHMRYSTGRVESTTRISDDLPFKRLVILRYFELRVSVAGRRVEFESCAACTLCAAARVRETRRLVLLPGWPLFDRNFYHWRAVVRGTIDQTLVRSQSSDRHDNYHRKETGTSGS